MNKKILAIVAAAITSNAYAFDYWIDNAADGGADPTTPAECADITEIAPAATIPAILAQCGIDPGDVFTFKAGTYTYAQGVFQGGGAPRFVWEGTINAPVTLRADPGAAPKTVIFDGNFGFTASPHTQVTGIKFIDSAGIGNADDVLIIGSGDITFTDIEVTAGPGAYNQVTIGASKDCVKISGDTFITDITFDDVHVHDCPEDAIDITGNGDITVINSLFENFWHFQIKGGSENVTIANSTFDTFTYGITANAMGCENVVGPCGNVSLNDPAIAVEDRYHAKNVVLANLVFKNGYKDRVINPSGWHDVWVSGMTCPDGDCSGNVNTTQSWYVVATNAAYFTFDDSTAATYATNNPGDVVAGCTEVTTGNPCYKILLRGKNWNFIDNDIHTQTNAYVQIDAGKLAADDFTEVNFYGNTFTGKAGTERWRIDGVSYFSFASYPVGKIGPCGEGGPDVTPPTIALTGANPQLLEINTAYSELGAVCSDNVDADKAATPDATAVDNTTTGNYDVTYDCTDAAGNNATQVIRTVTVFDPAASLQRATPARGSCTEETGLSDADDGNVLMCEQFDAANWYEFDTAGSTGWSKGQGTVDDRDVTPATDLNVCRVVSGAACVNGVGNCLECDWPVGVERSLSINWHTARAYEVDPVEYEEFPQEMYVRYYMKWFNGWNSDEIDKPDSGGNGKLPGFVDGRISNEAPFFDDCGNGGATADGIRCYSVRGLFYKCEEKLDNDWADGSSCSDLAGGLARLGAYMYVNGNGGQGTGANGVADGYGEDQTLALSVNITPCRRSGPPGADDFDPTCYNTDYNNYYAGIGGGLGQEQESVIFLDKWYAIEHYVKMNTPGVSDGVLKIWINDKLSYDKRNMRYREVGHNNLFIRNFWANIYKGGISGNTTFGQSIFDQIVIAKNRIRAIPDIVTISEIKPGTWYEVPNSAMSATIDSCPADNCSYSGNIGFRGIVDAYSGGAYDIKRDEMLIFGGGHNDYGGNEVAGFALDTMSWRLLTTPSAATPDAGLTYADGRPVSRHTYGTLQYSPRKDALMVFGSGSTFGPASASDSAVWSLSLDGTPTWSQETSIPLGTGKIASTVIDPRFNEVYWFASNQSAIGIYDVTGDSWSTSGNFVNAIHMTAAFAPYRKKALRLGRNLAYMYDLSGTPSRISLNSESAYTTSDTDNLDQHDMPGLLFDEDRDVFVWWHPSAGASVYEIDPVTYVVSEVTPDPSNTVTPVSDAAIGVNGRFRYSPKYGVYVLVTSVDRNVKLYKPFRKIQ